MKPKTDTSEGVGNMDFSHFGSHPGVPLTETQKINIFVLNHT